MDVFGKITLALHYASLATNDSQVTHYLAKIRPPAAVAKSTRPFGSWTSQGSGPPVSPDGTAMLRQYTDVFQNQILRLLTAGILRSDQDIPHFVSHGLAGTSSIDPNQHSAQETGKLPQWNKFGSQNDSSSETGMPWSSTAHVKDSKLSIVHSESFGSNLTMSSSAGKPDKQRISLFRRWCSTLKRRVSQHTLSAPTS